MILKLIFAQIFVFQWTKVKACFGRVFDHFMQKTHFEENKHFEYIFYRIEVQVITNPSSQLEKKTLEFLL